MTMVFGQAFSDATICNITNGAIMSCNELFLSRKKSWHCGITSGLSELAQIWYIFLNCGIRFYAVFYMWSRFDPLSKPILFEAGLHRGKVSADCFVYPVGSVNFLPKKQIGGTNNQPFTWLRASRSAFLAEGSSWSPLCKSSVLVMPNIDFSFLHFWSLVDTAVKDQQVPPMSQYHWLRFNAHFITIFRHFPQRTCILSPDINFLSASLEGHFESSYTAAYRSLVGTEHVPNLHQRKAVGGQQPTSPKPGRILQRAVMVAHLKEPGWVSFLSSLFSLQELSLS